MGGEGGWEGRGRGRGRYFEEVGVAGFVEVDVGVGGVFGLGFVSGGWERRAEGKGGACHCRGHADVQARESENRAVREKFLLYVRVLKIGTYVLINAKHVSPHNTPSPNTNTPPRHPLPTSSPNLPPKRTNHAHESRPPQII